MIVMCISTTIKEMKINDYRKFYKNL
jgi:hypothetical protein